MSNSGFSNPTLFLSFLKHLSIPPSYSLLTKQCSVLQFKVSHINGFFSDVDSQMQVLFARVVTNL